jgi:hypothetical protein
VQCIAISKGGAQGGQKSLAAAMMAMTCTSPGMVTSFTVRPTSSGGNLGLDDIHLAGA